MGSVEDLCAIECRQGRRAQLERMPAPPLCQGLDARQHLRPDSRRTVCRINIELLDHAYGAARVERMTLRDGRNAKQLIPIRRHESLVVAMLQHLAQGLRQLRLALPKCRHGGSVRNFRQQSVNHGSHLFGVCPICPSAMNTATIVRLAQACKWFIHSITRHVCPHQKLCAR